MYLQQGAGGAAWGGAAGAGRGQLLQLYVRGQCGRGHPHHQSGEQRADCREDSGSDRNPQRHHQLYIDKDGSGGHGLQPGSQAGSGAGLCRAKSRGGCGGLGRLSQAGHSLLADDWQECQHGGDPCGRNHQGFQGGSGVRPHGQDGGEAAGAGQNA